MPKLYPIKLCEFEFLVNPNVVYYAYFSLKLREKVKTKKATNVVITGKG